MEDVDTTTEATLPAVDTDTTTTATTITTTTIPRAQNECIGEKRNKNLEVLGEYIQRQRMLLKRIQSDIEHLQQRKQSVDDDPYRILHLVLNNDKDEESSQDRPAEEPERLSALVREVRRDASITKHINWKALEGQNASPLNVLSKRFLIGARPSAECTDVTTPLASSTASLSGHGIGKTPLSAYVYLTPECQRSHTTLDSPLRTWVRAKRIELIEPALEKAAQHLATSPPDSDDECTTSKTEEQQKQYSGVGVREARDARTKDRNMMRGKAVNRRKGNAGLGLMGASTPQPRGSGGRFTRRKSGEEKPPTPDHTDYGTEGGVEANRQSFSPATSGSVISTPVNRLLNVKSEEERCSAADSQTCFGDMEMEMSDTRASRGMREYLSISVGLTPQGRNDGEIGDPSIDSDVSSPCEHLESASTSITSNGGSSCALNTPILSASAAQSGLFQSPVIGNEVEAVRGKIRSATFNQSWSDEEQRLLDLLLERFPDGTKNRWASISRAMGGRRTPRQVASRVQKYFAKMKKWGLEV